MAGRKPPRRRPRRPLLTVEQILSWCEAHHQRTGAWPKTDSGPVHDSPADNWRNLDNALRYGFRSLEGGSSLARLLDEHRGVRNVHDLPPLTEGQILRWAKAHHRLTSEWPDENAGPVHGADGEAWRNIDAALRQGLRGFPGGSSLARLLARRLKVRNRLDAPPLTVEQILQWADKHRRRTGKRPTTTSGPIPSAGVETWLMVDHALRQGLRGLPGSSSLARLLDERQGPVKPPLSVAQVLAWANAFHERTGRWPTAGSGPIPDHPGLTWNAVNQALAQGLRGLPKATLTMLLREHGQTR